MTAPPALKAMDEEISTVRLEKEAAIDAQDFEGAASLRDKEGKLQEARAEKEKAWKNGELDEIAEVDDELIAEVLANSTGIPVVKLTEEESTRLLNMEDELHKRVIGQDEAIKAISQAIRRTRAGLKDPNRPGGSFIFAGPTGVGKTELAKALAEFLFGEEDALITLDMSEYSEKHTVSRLFGAPPGYVGYEEGGQLTEKVRRRPFSVVLFDEVEKAHADLFNSLLQILEDGRLTDSQGRVVDFKNTVIIMTTNLGTRDISKGVMTGFQSATDTKTGYNRMQAKVQEELRQHFRPEFLNRVDDVVVFPQLTQDEIVEIVDLFLGRLKKRLADRDMTIELSPAATRPAGDPRLRSGHGCPSAAPHHAARHRGPALREDPLRRADARPAHQGRRRGRRRRRDVHLPRRGRNPAARGRTGTGRPSKARAPASKHAWGRHPQGCRPRAFLRGPGMGAAATQFAVGARGRA